ncbi:unnamed protein product [Bursaphelenchus okinawaensis]|uniref:Uncharacterized protein n=1 Tax=Bursaphelenchus okinawaensis TaxID=465554 RepID=A0A811KRP1_9BILA|nr:unnamed protein product [Bursaphelenchus okinawaensis]CAG9110212.1 unnamed protein product [Bursaphelenchus okinawaensis]
MKVPKWYKMDYLIWNHVIGNVDDLDTLYNLKLALHKSQTYATLTNLLKSLELKKCCYRNQLKVNEGNLSKTNYKEQEKYPACPAQNQREIFIHLYDFQFLVSFRIPCKNNLRYYMFHDSIVAQFKIQRDNRPVTFFSLFDMNNTQDSSYTLLYANDRLHFLIYQPETDTLVNYQMTEQRMELGLIRVFSETWIHSNGALFDTDSRRLYDCVTDLVHNFDPQGEAVRFECHYDKNANRTLAFEVECEEERYVKIMNGSGAILYSIPLTMYTMIKECNRLYEKSKCYLSKTNSLILCNNKKKDDKPF